MGGQLQQLCRIKEHVGPDHNTEIKKVYKAQAARGEKSQGCIEIDHLRTKISEGYYS